MTNAYARCSAFRCALFISVALLGVGLSTVGNAQNVQGIQLPNMVGMGVVLTPDYPGADSRSASAGPFLQYQFPNSQRSVSVLGPLASFNVINDSAWHAGPALRYRGGRKDADNPVVHQLHEIGATVEAGAFVSYLWSGKGSVPWRVQISTSVLRGFSRADGTRAAIDAFVLTPVSHRIFLGLGGSINVIDRKTMNGYFGITPTDSLASGLPIFQPGGGNNSNDLWLTAAYLINSKWVVAVGGYWQHLRGNAAGSPWVIQQGNVNQITIGAGIAYLWK